MTDLEKRFAIQGERRKAYYSGSPIVSDEEFDIEEDKLKKLDPENDYFSQVGSKPLGSNLIRHTNPMLSMSKIKISDNLDEVDDQILSWLKSIGMPPDTLLCQMAKIDGFSLRIRYKDGNFVYACTRGDGQVGEIIKYPECIEGIPKKVPYLAEIDILGEGFIPQQFKMENDIFENASLRNLAYGIASRDNKTDDLKYLRFVAYDMTGPKKILSGPVSHKSMLDYLQAFMPYVVEHKLVRVNPYKKDPGVERLRDVLVDYISEKRDAWPYESDGVVLMVDDKMTHRKIDEFRGGAKTFHHFAKAIKPPERTGTSSLVNIEWNVAKDWDIIPVAIFKKVKIGSAEFTNATLVNADSVEKLSLQEDDTLVIKRANDVIPKIVEVIHGNGRKFLIPDKCPACGSKVEKSGKHIHCTNYECVGRAIALVMHWIRENNILNVGVETIRDLFKCGAVKTIDDLYRVDLESALSVIPGYSKGGKRIANVNEAVRKSMGITEFEIMSRIGIPGIKSHVLKNFGIKNIEDIMKFQEVKPYIYERAKVIHEWISDLKNAKLLKDLASILKAKRIETPETIESNGIRFCITGEFPRSRDEIIDYLESKGYSFTTSVSSKTHCLIRGVGIEGGKVIKAESLGIPIVGSVEEFEKMFKK